MYQDDGPGNVGVALIRKKCDEGDVGEVGCGGG